MKLVKDKITGVMEYLLRPAEKVYLSALEWRIGREIKKTRRYISSRDTESEYRNIIDYSQ